MSEREPDFHFVLQFMDDEETLYELDLDHFQVGLKDAPSPMDARISIALSGAQYNDIRNLPALAERILPPAVPPGDVVERARDIICWVEDCAADTALLVPQVAAALQHERDAAHKAGFKEAIEKTAPGWQDLHTALRLIKDAVEELGPVAAVASRDVGPPNPVRDAEDTIEGIKRTIDAAHKAAVEALREPTEAMVEAAMSPEAMAVSDDVLNVRSVWRAMIGAALATPAPEKDGGR